MSHPTCCCSVSLDRCDRCDLLVGLEGFHLMSVARTPDALVLNVESCNQLVGCPGCGVIAQGHGRVVVEVIDAPWAGSLCGSGGTIRRWMAEGARLLINDPARFEGVRVIGVDEHVWRHTPYGDKYVTVILDLTPIRDRSGPSRLLDMIPGRSKRVFKTWLASQPDTWRERIEIVAMDGFTGFKSAAAEELPGARAVMDPFHVVHLASDALDECRRRIQQELHHRRGRATDPLYKARRMLHTRSCLLTPRQQHQLLNLFSGEEHVALEVTWSAYQNIIDAYRAPDTDAGKALMEAEINTLTSTRVPRGLTELITLGRTLKRRAGDILAYFDHPHTSNGPTEAINGRLEHLRGSALGLAKPHQLHHPSTPRNRRIQTPTTPPIMKSRIWSRFGQFCFGMW